MCHTCHLSFILFYNLIGSAFLMRSKHVKPHSASLSSSTASNGGVDDACRRGSDAKQNEGRRLQQRFSCTQLIGIHCRRSLHAYMTRGGRVSRAHTSVMTMRSEKEVKKVGPLSMQTGAMQNEGRRLQQCFSCTLLIGIFIADAASMHI